MTSIRGFYHFFIQLSFLRYIGPAPTTMLRQAQGRAIWYLLRKCANINPIGPSGPLTSQRQELTGSGDSGAKRYLDIFDRHWHPVLQLAHHEHIQGQPDNLPLRHLDCFHRAHIRDLPIFGTRGRERLIVFSLDPTVHSTFLSPPALFRRLFR